MLSLLRGALSATKTALKRGERGEGTSSMKDTSLIGDGSPHRSGDGREFGDTGIVFARALLGRVGVCTSMILGCSVDILAEENTETVLFFS